jgi:hypothetical protein
MPRAKRRRVLRKEQDNLILKLAPNSGNKLLNLPVSLTLIRRGCEWATPEASLPTWPFVLTCRASTSGCERDSDRHALGCLQVTKGGCAVDLA